MGKLRQGTTYLISAAIMLAVSGCVNTETADLDNYINEIKARKAKRIEPLPEIKLPEIYVYASNEEVDPFQPFLEEQPPEQQATAVDNGIRPDGNRNREELEGFPLDSLRMVGTLERDDEVWALVGASDGAVYRVQPGNYLGKNHGKVNTVSEDRIELTEIIPDGLGGWRERLAKLVLSE